MPKSSAALSIEPRFRINHGRRLGFGPGKADLLGQIEQTGSITEAAKAMGMSYMRAWTLIKSMEHGFAEPLVRKVRGGHTHGGAELTDTGKQVLEIYRELEDGVLPAVRRAKKRLGPLLQG